MAGGRESLAELRSLCPSELPPCWDWHSGEQGSLLLLLLFSTALAGPQGGEPLWNKTCRNLRFVNPHKSPGGKLLACLSFPSGIQHPEPA